MSKPIPRPILAIAAAAMITAVTGCGDEDAASEEASATVVVETFNFQPDPLEVEAGTTITFSNRDEIDHTVTAGTRDDPEPERFDGQLPEEGATFDLTLEDPGTYPYFCDIHPGPGMTATIVVR